MAASEVWQMVPEHGDFTFLLSAKWLKKMEQIFTVQH